MGKGKSDSDRNFDPTSVTAEFGVGIRRNYGETVGVNRSAEASMPTLTMYSG